MIYIDKPIKAYASKLEQKGKTIVGTVSTSRKDKQSDNWVKSFWNARFVGGKPVSEGKIEISKAMLTNEKSENGKYYVNLVVFEWQQEGTADFHPVDDQEELPF